jgi:hypothetical protein
LPGDTDETPTFKAAVPVETIREGPTPPEFEGLDPLRTAVIHAEFAPLPLKQEGLIKVRAYRGDLEIKLGSLKIRAQQAQQPEPAIPSDEISDLEIEKPN